MHSRYLLCVALYFSCASASWFSSGSSSPEPRYTNWKEPELRAWLIANNVPTPAERSGVEDLRKAVANQWSSAGEWTQDQYHSTQKSFKGVKENAFDLWDEATLRHWLSEQGVNTPDISRDDLVLAAKQRYGDYQTAASRWSDWASASASSVADQATSLGGSLYNDASATGTSVAGQASSSGASAADWAASSASSAAARAASSGSSAAGGAASSASSAAGRAGSSGTSAAGQAASSATSLAGQASSSGSSIVGQAGSSGASLASDASATGASAAGRATSSVASAAGHASASVSSFAAEATKEAKQALDNTKDYVYSSWEDAQLHDYLVDKGLIKSNTQKKRDEMLGMMNDAYARVADPTWNAWSTSYMHKWLAQHNLLPESQLTWTDKYEGNRDQFINTLQSYYYDVNQNVWDSWTDNDLHSWLVQHGIIKSQATLTREKMAHLVSERYNTAASTLVSAWSTSELRHWLINLGVIDDRTAAGKNRDELIALANQNYNSLAATAKQQSLDAKAKAASYLTWPDARLRAYLKESGLSEQKVPTQREELLRKVRDVYEHGTWVLQEQNEGLLAKVRETARFAEAKIEKAWELVKDKVEL